MCATYYGGIMKPPAETSTECRRTTRISTILADLYRDAASDTQGLAGGIGQVAGPMGDPREPHTKPPGECVSASAEIGMGEILDRAHHAGFGFVAALLALVSIPLVGLTVPFGLAVAALGVQMVAGVSRPWLPRSIRRRRITAATLESLSRRAAQWTAKMTRVIRPRLPWLTAGPFWTLCGVGLVIQGLFLTLPIPGADWLFVVPIVLYGVGLLERDGLLILVCHVVTLTQVVMGVVLWELISRGFADAYHWCASVLN